MERPALGGLELAREAGDLTVLQSALDAVTASDWQQGRHRSAVEHTGSGWSCCGMRREPRPSTSSAATRST